MPGLPLTRNPVGYAPASQIFGTSPDVSPSAQNLGNLPTSGGGLGDLAQLLKGSESSVSMEDITKALSPQVTGMPMQMPSYFTREIPNPPPVQLDQREMVGAGNARGQGIANSISATVGALAQFKAIRDRQKQEADATKVQRLIEAQYGITQAQQALQAATDPQTKAAAQESLQHNQDVLNGLFQDPKFVRTIEKGFNISLTDPSQNKTPEHGIVQRGIDLFKKKNQQPFTQQQAQAIQQRFQKQQPTMLAPNQYAMQQLQLKMEMDKAKAAMFKDRIEAAKMMYDYQGKVDTERIRAAWEMQKEQMKDAAELAKEATRIGGEKALIDYRAESEIAVNEAKAAFEERDPNKLQEAIAKLTDTYVKSNNETEKQEADIIKMIKEEQTAQEADTANTADYQERITELRTRLQQLRDGAQVAKNHYESSKNYYNYLLKLPGMGEPAAPKVGAGATGGMPNAAGAAGTRTTTDIDPRTRKQWDRRVSPLDREIIKRIYGGTKAIHELENILDPSRLDPSKFWKGIGKLLRPDTKEKPD